MASSALEDLLSTFHLFSHLPHEIQRQIWQQSLTPRTLSLNLRFKKNLTTVTQPSRDPSLPPQYNFRNTIATFTVREGIYPHPIQKNSPDSRLDAQLFPVQKFRLMQFLSDAQREKPPRGPVILRVCRKSREVALGRYGRAFQGVNMIDALEKNHGRDDDFDRAFEDSGVGIPKIWVDLERDTVLFVGADGEGGNWGIDDRWEGGLSNYVKFAREEVAKVRNLAVAGTWWREEETESDHDQEFDAGRDLQSVWQDLRGGGELGRALSRSLRAFESLEVLKVYCTEGHRVASAPASYAGLTQYEVRNSPTFVGWREGSRDLGLMRVRIKQYLEKEKEKCDAWRTELPEIQVSRDIQWREDRNGELLLAFQEA